MAKSICSVDGCDRFVAGWTFCDLHYRRYQRLGTVHLPTAQMRFWAKVDKAGPIPTARPDLGPCWLWTARIGHVTGYGQFSRGTHAEGTASAHKYAYVDLIGPVPEGLHLDHLCRVRACVNPSHLEPVTQRVNVLRGETIPAANAAKTHCKHGHEFTPENIYRAPRRSDVRDCLACRRSRSPRRVA